ncbi:hypothetical protein N9Y99_04650, partial [Amylibacter sp.]|nr:hypothetical protein [Amylibacter sp.]
MKIVYVPRVNPNDESVTVNKYMLKNGSQVSTNDLVIEIETSKVAQEIEAPIDGFIEYTCIEGSEIDVGTELFRIHEVPFESSMEIHNDNSKNKKVRKISKKAESLLKENNIDPNVISGTGIITLKNVEQFINANRSFDSELDSNQISSSQKMVAQNLRLSIDTNAHARLTARINIDDNSIPNGATFLDLIAISVTKALCKYNSFNENLIGETISKNNNINIGFTIDHDGKLLILSVPSCKETT